LGNDDGAVGDGGGDSANNEPCVYVVEESLRQPTTFERGCVYLIEEWDFWVEAPLTVEPGAIIKLSADRGPGLALGDRG